MELLQKCIDKNKLIDTHIHPRPNYICIDVLEKYLEMCYEHGINVVGFVEHGKRCNKHKSILNTREKVNEFKLVCSSLQDKWKNKLKILCGIEIDYFDNFFETDEYIREIRKSSADFIIGSVHGKSLDNYEEYLLATIDLIKNYNIDILGHMQFADNYKNYLGLIEYIFHLLNEKKIFFEINMARRYNVELRLKEIKNWIIKYKVEYTWGSDAHEPQGMDVQLLEREYKRRNGL